MTHECFYNNFKNQFLLKLFFKNSRAKFYAFQEKVTHILFLQMEGLRSESVN